MGIATAAGRFLGGEERKDEQVFSSDGACRVAIRSAASRWGDNGLSSDVACRVAIKGAASQ